MEFNYSVLLVTATIFVVFTKGNCLQCFSCNNKIEPKCGTTWELSDEDAAKYLVTCEEDSVACKKIDTTDTLNSEVLVTRSCWSTNASIDDDLYGCTSISSAGKACYCKDGKDGKPCNGKQPLLTYTALFVSLISAVVCLVARAL